MLHFLGMYRFQNLKNKIRNRNWIPFLLSKERSFLIDYSCVVIGDVLEIFQYLLDSGVPLIEGGVAF